MLIDRKVVTEKFNPIQFTLTVESEAELTELWARLLLSKDTLRDAWEKDGCREEAGPDPDDCSCDLLVSFWVEVNEVMLEMGLIAGYPREA